MEIKAEPKIVYKNTIGYTKLNKENETIHKKYEYETETHFYSIILTTFRCCNAVYIIIQIDGTKKYVPSSIRYIYNCNNKEHINLQLYDKAIYGEKEQNIQVDIQNILQYFSEREIKRTYIREIGI